MPNHDISADALAQDWNFWKAPAGELRLPVSAVEVAGLRARDILALLEHGQMSTRGFNWFSEPKR